MRPTRPSYALLQEHFPTPKAVPASALFQLIGHPEKAKDPLWQNTCAIRVSLALVAAGMSIPAGLLYIKATAGKYRQYKGRSLEIKQEALAALLNRDWGEAEKFGAALMKDRVAGRRGVIRFLQLWGPFDPQGHIDLVAPDQWNRLACQGSCYHHAVEVWFWPLE